MIEKRALIILTLNEIEGIRFLFSKIPFGKIDEILVVDGGSTDGTLDFLKERGIRYLVQDKKGRGEAFRLGVANTQASRLVFFSPDGNENPEDIIKLLDLLDSCDMAIASRFLKGAHNEEDGKIFPLRAWVNRIFTLFANIVWNKDVFVTDTINGFRAIKREVFEALNIDARGYVIEYQMSIRAMRLGYKIKEIPTWEGERIGGESQAKSLPTGIVFLRFLVRELFIRRTLINSKK